MIQRTIATVESVTSESDDAQELLVRSVEAEDGELKTRRAINFTAMNGRVEVGDSVLLNTCAVELGLGTGGWDFVIARLNEDSFRMDPPGHVLKLRYTPLQFPILACESQESPHHDKIRKFDSLNETPVICAELHSQLPGVCAGAIWHLQESGHIQFPRIAYIMTSGASLPIALSRNVAELKRKNWLSATITSGHAFGGDHEAINLYSALAIAKEVVEADLIIVCQGPGNVGTETPLGFSGIEQGEAINAVASLGGNPILCPRISFADSRERHEGLSHHTLTVLKKICHVHATVALPRFTEPHRRGVIQDEIESARLEDRYDFISVEASGGLSALKESGIRVTTMGRTISEDPEFFLTSVASGILGGQCVEAKLHAAIP